MRDSAPQQRFKALYEANYARMMGYALRRTACPEDAADVVADVFMTAWRKFDEVPGGEEATLWLYGVARRVLANHRRGQESRSTVVQMLARDYEDAFWAGPPPERGGVGRELTEAWGALTPDDRDLLGLVVWETLTLEQIAMVLGCARPVAKVRIHRARRRFARELARHGYPLKPETLTRHVQAGRAEALPDVEAM